jgi:hypothetical protein
MLMECSRRDSARQFEIKSRAQDAVLRWRQLREDLSRSQMGAIMTKNRVE